MYGAREREMEESIASGLLRNDTDRRGMTGGGYAVGWSAPPPARIPLEIEAYVSATQTPPYNHIGVRLPADVDRSRIGTSDIRELLTWLIEVSQPAWAAAEDFASRSHRASRDYYLPPVSWMLYLRDGLVRPFSDASVSARRFADGILYTTTQEWFDPGNAQHDRAARHLESVLIAHGLREIDRHLSS